MGVTVLYVLIVLLILVSLWLIIRKAGRLGVSQIIPIWNVIEWVRISGKPLWWVVLILLIPIVNIVI